MRRFIRKLFIALLPDDKARRAMRHSTRYSRPALERLEERALMSAGYSQLRANQPGVERRGAGPDNRPEIWSTPGT